METTIAYSTELIEVITVLAVMLVCIALAVHVIAAAKGITVKRLFKDFL